jgi:hypothetical protein
VAGAFTAAETLNAVFGSHIGRECIETHRTGILRVVRRGRNDERTRLFQF